MIAKQTEPGEYIIVTQDGIDRTIAGVVKLRVASMPNADKFQLHIYAALAEQER
jgi:hypothetical protein